MLFRLAVLFGLLPVVAGCCCCGGGTSTQVSPADLAKATSLEADGLGNLNVNVGGEPYSIESEGLSTSELTGSKLKFSLFGDVTTSLPQVSEIHTKEATVKVNGVDVPDLTVITHGMGDITVSGKATNVKVEITGLGDVDLTGLEAETADVTISGGGDAKLNVSTTLTVNNTGSGSVTNEGDAEVPGDDTSDSGDGTNTTDPGDNGTDDTDTSDSSAP